MNRKASDLISEAFLFKTHSALIKQIYSGYINTLTKWGIPLGKNGVI